MCVKINNKFRSGAALLIVLFIVMVITLLSLGFLSRSDVELACGKNMVLRTQMDYLAESGLEHAKGLILNPQDLETEYYTGSPGLQLVEGRDDYYNVSVTLDNSDPKDQCNYTIDCNAFKLKAGERIGESNLRAQLRLDPCVALWTEGNTAIWDFVKIYGDVFCNGVLNSCGTIDGDVFANELTGKGARSGQRFDADELSLVWPGITVNGFSDKPGVTYQSGDFTLSKNVEGMLLIDGNLTVRQDSKVKITASKNQPALYVTQDLIIEKNVNLDIEGLAAVGGNVFVNSDANVNIVGGLFTKGTLYETASDSSSYNNCAVLYNGPEWTTGLFGGALKFDGSDDKIENSSVPDLINGLPAITFSLWVKSDVTSEDRDIFYTCEPTGADEGLGIRYDRTGASGGGVDGIKASIRTTTGYAQIESASGVQTSDWQHLAITWESDSLDSHLKLYINGVLDTPRYDRGPVYGVVTGIQKLMLGCGSKNTHWDGLIDDVRVYDRALSSKEVNDVKAGANVTGLILHWDFDESRGIVNVIASPQKTAINIFSDDGDVEKWGQAAGAFYRSIQRR